MLKSLYLSMDDFRLSFIHEILRHAFRNKTCIQDLVIQVDIFLLIEIYLLLPTAHQQIRLWHEVNKLQRRITFRSYCFSLLLLVEQILMDTDEGGFCFPISVISKLFQFAHYYYLISFYYSTFRAR